MRIALFYLYAHATEPRSLRIDQGPSRLDVDRVDALWDVPAKLDPVQDREACDDGCDRG